MGNRRLGRKRLYALEKEGQSMTKSAGASVTGALGSVTQLRDGNMIITEFLFDLAASGSENGYQGFQTTAAAVATGLGASPAAPAGSRLVAHANPAGNAQICTVTRTDKIDMGVISAGELITVETLAGAGGKTLGLMTSPAISASQTLVTDTDGSTELLAPANHTTVGTYSSFEVDADIDGDRIYLNHTGSGAGVYTSGKLVLRLFGYDVFDDVDPG
jgi:hypothetical protein